MSFNKLMTATALALSMATAASAGGTLVYCSEGSPEGFDPALYTSGTTFDAASSNSRPAPPRWFPASPKAGKPPTTGWNTPSTFARA
jgi:ABC-type transport system substrate-binding protein